MTSSATAETPPAPALDLVIGQYARDDLLLAGAEHGPRAEVYRYPEVAVVLGRGSRPEIELDLAAIAEDRVPLLRRRGGGCAVVLDPGNLVVSLAMHWPGLGGIHSAYEEISAWLIDGLARIGIPGVVKQGSSDLALDDLKIGGACMYRSRDLLYYSTTLLYQPDRDRIDRYLRHPPREPIYRRSRSHRDFMGALAETSAAASADDLAARLRGELARSPLLTGSVAIH